MSTTTFYSPAFGDQMLLPVRFAAEGSGWSPPLNWRRVPKQKPNLAIFVRVMGGATPEVRWLVYNVLEFLGPIPENSAPSSGTVGVNSQGHTDWWAPDAKRQILLQFDLFAYDRPLEPVAALSWTEVNSALSHRNVHGPITFQAHYPVAPGSSSS
ncbi:MAG: hypothetical protein ACU0BB_05660 [Paracoccaceae bacterium]